MFCASLCLVTTVNLTETAEQIVMLLGGIWTKKGPRNHMLVGDLDPWGRGKFRGHVPTHCRAQGAPGVRLIFSPLFDRWKQRCGLSLSVLQQLVLSLLRLCCIGEWWGRCRCYWGRHDWVRHVFHWRQSQADAGQFRRLGVRRCIADKSTVRRRCRWWKCCEWLNVGRTDSGRAVLLGVCKSARPVVSSFLTCLLVVEMCLSVRRDCSSESRDPDCIFSPEIPWLRVLQYRDFGYWKVCIELLNWFKKSW